MIAAITQPSQGWKASRRIASQIPKAITPTRPTIARRGRDHRDPVRLSVVSGVSAERSRDDDDPGHDERADERRREQQVNREDPVLEAHAAPTVQERGRDESSSSLGRDLLDDVMRDRVDLLVRQDARERRHHAAAVADLLLDLEPDSRRRKTSADSARRGRLRPSARGTTRSCR